MVWAPQRAMDANLMAWEGGTSGDFKKGRKAHEKGAVRLPPGYWFPSCRNVVQTWRDADWLAGWDSRERDIASENAEADEEENRILDGLY